MVRAVQLYAWFAPGKQQVIWLSAIGSSVYNVQVVGKALLVSGEMSSLFQLLSISLRIPWDYGDYTDYANESVSAYWTQIHEPDPPPTGSSLQHLSEAGDLLTEREDIQGTQDHRVDYAISVINLTSHVHRQRFGLSRVKVTVLFMPTMHLLEKLGQAHMP